MSEAIFDLAAPNVIISASHEDNILQVFEAKGKGSEF